MTRRRTPSQIRAFREESQRLWIQRIFDAKAASENGVVRRSVATVEQLASPDKLEAEVRRRGFHMVLAGEQYVIICNSGRYQTIC
jgi:hypothetical protein